MGFRWPLLVTCFLLSGFAGLIYQTAWSERFALVFGTSELAIVTVLAAYMAGLAAGATAAAKFAANLQRPLLAYALLEIGIAASALAVPSAIDFASQLQIALLGGGELAPATAAGSALFRIIASVAILFIPTGLMGATLPVIARWAVRNERQIGLRIGALYATNTAGAAAGALIAGFVLLPRLGLGRTELIAAAANLLVFLLALLAANRSHQDRTAVQTPSAIHSGPSWILPVMLVSGAVSFTWEVLWTRLLAHILGGSVYAFATMLATFLVGIALGAALAARLASSVSRARLGLIISQVAIAGLSLSAFVGADHLPALAARFTTSGSVLWQGAALGIFSMLPGTIAIGATFPFAVRILASTATTAPAASARIFAWNTVGAIAGALLSGYLLLPTLGYAGTATVAVVSSLILGCIVALRSRPRVPLWSPITIVALAAIVWSTRIAADFPATPWAVLRNSPLHGRTTPGEVVFASVGKSASVLLTDQRSSWRLATNGLPESSIEPRWGRPGRFIIARWLSLLPTAVRPATKSLLIVGFGAGVSVEDLPATVEEIHVVELEPEVIRANRMIADQRSIDPLADPRVRIHLNDARDALRLSDRRYDAIVSQPSHPWTSGSSHLFTREFFSQVKDRLSEDGVMVQWMGLKFVDGELLRSLVATACDVFPYVELYSPQPGAVLIVGSRQPLQLGPTAADAIASAPRQWERIGVLGAADVRAARLLDNRGTREFSATGVVSTDAHNLLRVRSPRVVKNPASLTEIQQLLEPFDTLAKNIPEVDAPYLVRRLIRQRATRRARTLAQSMIDQASRSAALAYIELAAGRRQLAQQHINAAIELDPHSVEVQSARLLHARPSIVRNQTVGGSLLPNEPTDDALSAIAKGWRLQARRNSAELRDLEGSLAGIGPRHPLFADATRLRVGWRLASNDVELAREALALLTPMLAPIPSPADLLLRARAALVAGHPRVALATLTEALTILRQAPRPQPLVRQIRVLVGSFQSEGSTEQWRQELSRRLGTGRPSG